MSYQSADSKKAEFRKYLDKTGVVDAMTKVLVTLYEEPERPSNPLDFIKQYLGGPSTSEYESLKAENESLRQEIADLKAKVESSEE